MTERETTNWLDRLLAKRKEAKVEQVSIPKAELHLAQLKAHATLNQTFGVLGSNNTTPALKTK